MPVKLVEAEDGDLDWIMNLERAARDQGFVSGDSEVRHRMRMNDRQCLYLIAKRAEESIGYVILIGVFGAEPVIELKRIVIAEAGAGKGSEVMRAVMDMAFGELNAHRLYLDVMEDNQRARHVYEKLGFKEEGRLREAVYRGGKWCDLIVYGLLARERT